MYRYELVKLTKLCKSAQGARINLYNIIAYIAPYIAYDLPVDMAERPSKS